MLTVCIVIINGTILLSLLTTYWIIVNIIMVIRPTTGHQHDAAGWNISI